MGCTGVITESRTLYFHVLFAPVFNVSPPVAHVNEKALSALSTPCHSDESGTKGCPLLSPGTSTLLRLPRCHARNRDPSNLLRTSGGRECADHGRPGLSPAGDGCWCGVPPPEPPPRLTPSDAVLAKGDASSRCRGTAGGKPALSVPLP